MCGLRTVLVLAFAAAVGHVAWEAVFSPVAPFTDGIVGEFPALVDPEPDGGRQLYLRRTVYLPQRPWAAWVRLVSHDRVRLYVNGRLVEGQALDGFDVAVVADVAPYLTVGPNVLAVEARQTRLRGRPAVAVDGAYVLSDGEHRITSDGGWHFGRTFERQADWWFGTDFDERRWPLARVAPVSFRARASVPPEAVTTPNRGRWVTVLGPPAPAAAFRHTFEVAGRPARAWLRVTTPAAYRLAVNGVVVDQQEVTLGLRQPAAPARRTYDVTPFTQQGANVVSLLLRGHDGAPRVTVDGEVRDEAGETFVLGTGAGWLGCAGVPAAWAAVELDPADAWVPCRVESGDLGIPPWGLGWQDLTTELPSSMTAARVAGQLATMAVLAALAWCGCRGAGRALGDPRSGVAYLALVPPTLACAAAALAAYDPRVFAQNVYRPEWVWAAVASVPLQWVVLAALGRVRSARVPADVGRWAATLLVVGAVGVGFWLRYRELRTEPLQWDEVENYNATVGLLRHGFPMFDVHPDLPPLVIHTSEFQFVFHAVAAVFTDEPRAIVRLPAVAFAAATIPLMFVIARRMFGRWHWVAAAWLYALSSVYIPMATVGRYFSELQFFTLLTVFLAWRAVAAPGAGPLPRGRLWAAVAAFLAMFFTWEASALVAPAVAGAAALACRGRLRAVLTDRHLWAAGGVVLLAYMLQRAHVNFAQTRFLWIGISLSDVRLLPMWEHQSFQPWYYLWESSWSQDALLPMLGLLAGLAAAAGLRPGPQRFLLLVYVPTCLGMAFLLPNYQFRYVYHVSPLLMLIAVGTVGRFAGGLVRLTPVEATGWRWYARAAAGLTAAAGVVVGCGLFVETRHLTRGRIDGTSAGLFKFPDLGGPARFVREHARPGDAVLSNNLFQTTHLMGYPGRASRPVDFIPVTGRLFLPATYLDHSDTLVDRRDGARVVASPEDFRDLVARYPRVWYVVQPSQHRNQNSPTVSDFVARNFVVVYEDYEAMVLFHGAGHLPAAAQERAKKGLDDAGIKILD